MNANIDVDRGGAPRHDHRLRRAASGGRAVLRLLLVPFLMLAACGDDSPAGPDPALEAAAVELSPRTLELELGEAATLTVTVRNATGAVLAGRPVTWTSSAPSVAEVDAAGRVTARTAGTATIQAEVDGVADLAAVTVLPFGIQEAAVLVDSAVLRLASDSAELEAGTFRFQVLDAAAAPAVVPGAVIVGAQGQGFLRRVTAVQSTGTTLTLQTTQAALVDAVRHGSFQTTVDLTSAPATLVPGAVPAEGEVLWGPARLVDPVSGVTLTAVGLDLSGVDLCQALGCPSAIKTFRLASGRIAFDPSLDLGATIEESELTAFHAIATGELTLDFSVLFEAQQSATFSRERTLGTVQRVFYAQVGWVPVIGIARFEVKAAFDAKATIKGMIQAGFVNEHTVSVGARYTDEDGWDGVLHGSQSFNAQQPSLSDSTLVGQIELEARVSVTPQLAIFLYGVAGPFVNVEPYGKATLSFGSEACSIRSVGGINTTLGFSVAMLDPKIGTFSHTFQPLAWPGLEWDCPLGHLDVATVTNGDDPDEDGYRILVDGEDKGAVLSTGSTLVEWVRVGTRTVELSGVAENCTVEGENPREIDVEIALVIPVDFTVHCEAERQAVYENDFETAAGPEWSVQTIETAPSGEKFLGPFSTAQAILTLGDLPAHDSVTVEFDLYIIDDWNGSEGNPDLITFRSGTTLLLRTTFSNNVAHRQSYPDPYPAFNPAGTGAIAFNGLGYPPPDEEHTWRDASYRITFTIPHSADTFDFRMLGTPTSSDEIWGIDNIRVTVK